MSDTTGNPLVGVRFRIPFDEIRAEHVRPAIRLLLEEAREALEKLAKGDGHRTYDNTMAGLDRFTEPLGHAVGVVRHLESVATTPEYREALNEVQPEVSAFFASIPLHAGLWKALKEFDATTEATQLDPVRKRFLTTTIEDFHRAGADLDAEGKAQLEKIDVELSRITLKFAQNTLDATNSFEMVIKDKAKLAGLPPSAVEAARESARAKGQEGWRFTLQQPDFLPVMTYLDDAGIREQFYRAHSTRASGGEFDNSGIIPRVLELRREKARLLGYADFSDMILEDRMAKSGARAQSFLDELLVKTEPHFHRENRELLDFRRELEGPEAPELAPWDTAYYAEKLREQRFDFNEEDLRPYFPLGNVVNGMFETGEPPLRHQRAREAGRAGMGSEGHLLRADRFRRRTPWFLLRRLAPKGKQARRRLDGCLHHRRAVRGGS